MDDSGEEEENSGRKMGRILYLSDQVGNLGAGEENQVRKKGDRRVKDNRKQSVNLLKKPQKPQIYYII